MISKITALSFSAAPGLRWGGVSKLGGYPRLRLGTHRLVSARIGSECLILEQRARVDHLDSLSAMVTAAADDLR